MHELELHKLMDLCTSTYLVPARVVRVNSSVHPRAYIFTVARGHNFGLSGKVQSLRKGLGETSQTQPKGLKLEVTLVDALRESFGYFGCFRCSISSLLVLMRTDCRLPFGFRMA